MEPRAFLDLAKQLSNNTTCEASLRTCVSRSYYAIFNSMAHFINTHVGRLPKSAEAHAMVFKYFFECGIESAIQIASDLNDLRDERNDSNYKLQEEKFRNHFNVVLLYKKAEIAFDSFEKIIQNSSRRKSIIKGIRQYKQKTNS